jgi:hypothetical protein
MLRSTAAGFAQFEFVRGKIRQIHKGRVPESDNLLWKRRAITQYLSHYHRERNNQGLGNRLLQAVAAIGKLHDPVIRC